MDIKTINTAALASAIEVIREDYDRDEIDAFSMTVDGDGDVVCSFDADYDLVILFEDDAAAAQALYDLDKDALSRWLEAFCDVDIGLNLGKWLRQDQLYEDVQRAVTGAPDYDPECGVANSWIRAWEIDGDRIVVVVTETVTGGGSVRHDSRWIVMEDDDAQGFRDFWNENWKPSDAHFASGLIRVADEAAGIEYED